MRHWKSPVTFCPNQIQKYYIQMDLVAFHLHSYLHMHVLYISLNYVYITSTFSRQLFQVFFTPAKTLPNSKSCPHLRLHTYFEKPEQLTDCLCFRGITAKILSDYCYSTCCALQHWYVSRKSCKIHAILTCGWLWTLSHLFLCISYFESCFNSSCF